MRSLRERREKARKELEKWRGQWPGASISRRVYGDEEVAKSFDGEARALMWFVKSSISLSGLSYISRSRRFPDGTVIRATSMHGADIIEIDTTKSIYATGFGCSCELKLIDVPEIIQPMRYPEIIGAGAYVEGRGWVPVEVEGVDYIKTYYKLEAKGYCAGAELDWTVCETSELGLDVGYASGGARCRPYYYSTPYRPYQTDWTPPTFTDPPEPNNHCVYSLWDHCNAEILSYGKDSGGTYIIWKAYTEWSNLGWQVVNFSRTGLGYLKLQATFKDKAGKDLCHSDEYIVQVDCCHKEEDLRKVILYWEAISGTSHCVDQPFFFYGTLQLCETPEEYTTSALLRDYINAYVGWWVLPELKGGCIPIDWELDGPGDLIVSSDTGMAEWFPPDGNVANVDCHESITVMATDRCGTEDKMVALSCCETNPEIELLYTSLLMGCAQSQTITAMGACYPVSWSVDHGTITYAGGDQNINIITYTSENVNTDCAHHPTLTVTDCCGKSATLNLYVSCAVGGTALAYDTAELCGACWWDAANVQCYAYHNFTCTTYDCNGDFIAFSESNPGCAAYQNVVNACFSNCPPTCQTKENCEGWCVSNPTLPCAGLTWCGFVGAIGWHDARTALMKSQGCCPLNPLTGLPY